MITRLTCIPLCILLLGGCPNHGTSDRDAATNQTDAATDPDGGTMNDAALDGSLPVDGGSGPDSGYVPPVIPNATRYNRDYYEKMVAEGKPTQQTPWGFQEIMLDDPVTHEVASIQEYKNLIADNTGEWDWTDGKVHVIHFAAGEYVIPDEDSYFVLRVPSRTIIEGAGIGQTIFIAVQEWNDNTTKNLFSFENAHDVVLRGLSFHNETRDNKWRLIYAVDWSEGAIRENFLFENIEFDDAFGALGCNNAQYNFVTFRGLRKRIGNTTDRIKANYSVPVPDSYQFASQNDDHIELAGQLGMRTGNSVVFHDCVLGDNISATIDTYNNYVEIVGCRFIDPLHDHSMKAPNANHIYVHDSRFELTYSEKIINNAYYNPTFFTHEGGTLTNYHFQNMTFYRAGPISNNGVELVESEPFTLYDNRENNVSGDMVWENISFEGYQSEVVGYPNVRTDLGFEAINYTQHLARPAQLKAVDQTADFTVDIEQRSGSSRQDVAGVYSWGQRTDGTIDYPRDNRTFVGTKQETESRPYVEMVKATVRDIYNARLQTR